jgi:ubiquinone/menaquinone biosynthesis C-methylase UbiE
MEINAQDLQKEYYSTTAKHYDNQHLLHGDEHYLALNYLDGIIRFYGYKSILDIGAGTGRAALFLRERNPSLEITSIEPVEALRMVGYAKGLSQSELQEGDVYELGFKDLSFDLVCAFGVFHHLQYPVMALDEMKRISKHAVFISDSNNLGQGSKISRMLKQVLYGLKLWNLAIFLKTKGKRYSISEEDGLAYSFSLFSLSKHLKSEYSSFFLSTVPSARNLFKSASHLAILAVKNNSN